LPHHIKLIPADSDISTLSLFDIMDVCLTVRGTIGIEASCFGIRVLTAGTGRYDRRGFTMDFDSPQQYLQALRDLPDIRAMSAVEIELARRFAFGVFMARPTRLSSVSFAYGNDTAARLKTRIIGDSEQLLGATDVRSIADWMASGEEDYFAIDPSPARAALMKAHAT
jgi:hypothetical protein